MQGCRHQWNDHMREWADREIGHFIVAFIYFIESEISFLFLHMRRLVFSVLLLFGSSNSVSFCQFVSLSEYFSIVQVLFAHLLHLHLNLSL